MPTLLPIVRTTVLALIASPVCTAGTLSMIAFEVDASARPMPAPVRIPETTMASTVGSRKRLASETVLPKPKPKP